MKPIGLIGGLTYVSTLDYYRHLNKIANEKLGGSHVAEIIMYSVNFGEIKVLTEKQDWETIAGIMSEIALKIEKAGAACLLLGANTMHKIADKVQKKINIPVIHIADAVAGEIVKLGFNRVALLGTKYTMQLGFYSERLSRYGIDSMIPDADDVEFINKTIYEEFSKNIFKVETKNRYLEIISKLEKQGAQAAILGCTEIPILLNGCTAGIPLLDTAKIHSAAGVDYVLNRKE